MFFEAQTLDKYKLSSYAEKVNSTQSLLRDYLLGSSNRIKSRPERDLAAYMLLFIEDSQRCSAVAVDWIRSELGCSRVDTGLGHCSDLSYFPGFAESRDPNAVVPTYAGATVNNTAKAMQLIWMTGRPTVFQDVAGDSRFDLKLHNMLVTAGTTSKMAAPVIFQGRSVGLICADWVGSSIPNSSALYERYESIVGEILSPILVASRELDGIRLCANQSNDSYSSPTKSALFKFLTNAELNVAQLAATGLPYKLIADRLNKSISTVDHQLRSIRRKLKVRTHAELAAVLVEMKPNSNYVSEFSHNLKLFPTPSLQNLAVLPQQKKMQ